MLEGIDLQPDPRALMGTLTGTAPGAMEHLRCGLLGALGQRPATASWFQRDPSGDVMEYPLDQLGTVAKPASWWQRRRNGLAFEFQMEKKRSLQHLAAESPIKRELRNRCRLPCGLWLGGEATRPWDLARWASKRLRLNFAVEIPTGSLLVLRVLLGSTSDPDCFASIDERFCAQVVDFEPNGPILVRCIERQAHHLQVRMPDSGSPFRPRATWPPGRQHSWIANGQEIFLDQDRWISLDSNVTGSPARYLACHALVGITMQLQEVQRIQFYRHGVALECVAEELACPGAFALVAWEGLKTDLSGFQIVRDEAYQQIVEYLRRELRRALEEVQPHLQHLSRPLKDYVTSRLPRHRT